MDRREVLTSLITIGITSSIPKMAYADDFQESETGLRFYDIKVGTGKAPGPGDKCVVHWAGYTEGYQGKKIDNTSVRDEPYSFVLGEHTAIPAFEEAVSGMKVGGVRRIQVLGSHPELSYPRDRSLRFDSEGGKFFKYRLGPQPSELGGQRALDFVLDNPTLQDFNRTLLFDIKLLSVRKK